MDRKGVSRFSVEVFLSQVAENIVGEPFCVSEMFWYQKFLDNRGITILPNFFVSHRQKSSWANRSVFQNYTGIKMFWTTGVRRFCRLFCLLMLKNFAAGHLFFGNVPVSKNFWITSYHHFVEIFCLMSPKIIVGEPVCVSEIFWFQNFSDNSGFFLLLIAFVSQCWKICGEPSNDLKKFRAPKTFMQNGGISRFSVANF